MLAVPTLSVQPAEKSFGIGNLLSLAPLVVLYCFINSVFRIQSPCEAQ